MSNHDRPLSPHLSIYRWPITMALSILHRATGIALSLGFVVLVVWLFDAAAGPEAYAAFTAIMGSLFGRILLFGWALAFFYHFSNGIRHLLWDSGIGLEKDQANRSSWVVLVATIVLTTGFWWAAS